MRKPAAPKGGIGRDDSVVGLYLQDINDAGRPLLTKEEQHALGRRIQKAAAEKKRGVAKKEWAAAEERQRNFERARNELVERNLRLVPSVAKKYIGRGVAFADLVQEGNLGLMKAAERFNPGKGFRFSTYAVWWIKQAVRRIISDHGTTIRVPAHIRETWSKVFRAAEDLRHAKGCEPSPREVAETVGLTEEETRNLRGWIERARPIRLNVDASVERSDGDIVLADTYRDVKCLSPLEHLEAKDELREACQTLSTLLTRLSVFPARWQVMFRMRYGFTAEGELTTLKKIGESFSITRERVRQILLKMDKWLEGNGFGAHRVKQELGRIRILENLIGTDTAELHTLLPPPVEPPPRPEKLVSSRPVPQPESTPAVPVGQKQFDVATILWPALSTDEAHPVDFRWLAGQMGQTVPQVRSIVYALARKGILCWERPGRFRRGAHLVLVLNRQARLQNARKPRPQNLNSFGPRRKKKKGV